MGTGNVTAMLHRGYIEVLFKAADTQLGREFEAALSGHAGVHLTNFAVVDAAKAHRRLTDDGFRHAAAGAVPAAGRHRSGPGRRRLHRGAARARRDAEGRIQMLTHRTEDTVWQKRWLTHPNGALGLIDVVIASADVAEAAARFARFTGREAKATQIGQATLVLDRGQVQLLSEAGFMAMLPEIPVPRLPFIGAYAIQVGSLPEIEELFAHEHLPCAAPVARWWRRSPTSSALAHGCSSRMPPICPGEADEGPLWKMQGAAGERDSRYRTQKAWQDQLFDVLKRADIRQVGYVPDAGHSRLIARCKADPDIRDVVLTTEEEGVALAAGAWLGGQRAALLMQSSGVGNCINMLSLIRACRFPMLMLVTMRGEWEEFNPWQVPMGSIVEPTLKLCDTHVAKVEQPEQVVPAVQNALQLAFGDDRAAAVLLSQKLIGRKVWVK